MSRQFEYCAKRVLGHEGGLVDHARDPGGRTNLGVTQQTLNHARGLVLGLPAKVDQLTTEQALAIYEALYWRPVAGDDLPLGLALIVFDAAINHGVADAVRFLQFAVRTAPDGRLGPKTLAAVAATPLRAAILEVAARRMHDYMLLDHLDDTFGLGWSRRLTSILADALAAPVAA